VNKEELITALDSMTAPDLGLLIGDLKDKWQIETPEMPQFEQQQQVVETVEEPTEFDVILTSFETAKKVPIIKLLREVLGLALSDAKEASTNLPKTLGEALSKEDAEALAAKVKEAGGEAEIK